MSPGGKKGRDGEGGEGRKGQSTHPFIHLSIYNDIPSPEVGWSKFCQIALGRGTKNGVGLAKNPEVPALAFVVYEPLFVNTC